MYNTYKHAYWTCFTFSDHLLEPPVKRIPQITVTLHCKLDECKPKMHTHEMGCIVILRLHLAFIGLRVWCSPPASAIYRLLVPHTHVSAHWLRDVMCFFSLYLAAV